MASIPCLKSENRCTPCAGDSSNPFANLSIEPFDINIWLGIYFGRPVNVTPNTWTTDACVGFCESAISQTDADDCARRRAEDCLQVEPPYDDPPPPEPPVSPALFCNQEVSCQSGSNCYTLPACTVFAGSQAEANAIAQSLCNSRVLDPALSSPCSGLPPEPPVEPVVPCPAESGTAAPDSLEITEGVSWNTDTLIPESDTLLPGLEKHYDHDLNRDYPPGHYQLRYVSGLLAEEDLPLSYGVPQVGLANTSYPDNATIDCDDDLGFRASNVASTSWRYNLGDEDNPYTHYCGPITGFTDWDDAPAVQNYANETFNGTTFGFPLVWAAQANENLNDGGLVSLRYINSTNALVGLVSVANYDLLVMVRQTEGLIPQPRKLQITSYSAPLFADPAGAAGWNGAFNTRDFYTAVGLRWTEAGVGSFGGAQVEYTMSHPTSASGRGWMLEIYSAGFVLMWRGYKAVGNTSIGRYYRDSTTTPIGPLCLVCADASDDVWYPGEAPP